MDVFMEHHVMPLQFSKSTLKTTRLLPLEVYQAPANGQVVLWLQMDVFMEHHVMPLRFSKSPFLLPPTKPNLAHHITTSFEEVK
jgi:hypothetical protein